MAVTIHGSSGITIPAGGTLTGVGSNSFTNFLGAQVNLNNASLVFDIVNTGSIGASGEMWEIEFLCAVGNSSTTVLVEAMLWDGTAYIANCGAYTVGTQGSLITLKKTVTLTGPTTFTGRAYSGNTSSYVASTQNCTYVGNTSTSISATRVK